MAQRTRSRIEALAFVATVGLIFGVLGSPHAIVSGLVGAGIAAGVVFVGWMLGGE